MVSWLRWWGRETFAQKARHTGKCGYVEIFHLRKLMLQFCSVVKWDNLSLDLRKKWSIDVEHEDIDTTMIWMQYHLILPLRNNVKLVLCLLVPSVWKSILVFKVSQDSPVCPSDTCSVKLEMSVENWWNNADREEWHYLEIKLCLWYSVVSFTWLVRKRN